MPCRKAILIMAELKNLKGKGEGKELFLKGQKQKSGKIAEQIFQPDREQRGRFCCQRGKREREGKRGRS